MKSIEENRLETTRIISKALYDHLFFVIQQEPMSCEIARDYLGLTEEEIRRKHPDIQIKKIDIADEIGLEIRLQKATLSCVLKKQGGKCTGAYIFFDEDN
jgi:hypothetical protein